MNDDAPAKSLPTAVPRQQVQQPSLLWCWLLILAVKLSLATVGFARTWRWLRAYCQSAAGTTDAPPGAVAAIEHTVAMAGALYPGRALCLEQSLVLFYLLRRRGIAAVFRMGIQPHPFQAHAWVELRGTPINDFVEHVTHFTAIPDDSL